MRIKNTATRKNLTRTNFGGNKSQKIKKKIKNSKNILIKLKANLKCNKKIKEVTNIK